MNDNMNNLGRNLRSSMISSIITSPIKKNVTFEPAQSHRDMKRKQFSSDSSESDIGDRSAISARPHLTRKVKSFAHLNTEADKQSDADINFEEEWSPLTEDLPRKVRNRKTQSFGSKLMLDNNKYTPEVTENITTPRSNMQKFMIQDGRYYSSNN